MAHDATGPPVGKAAARSSLRARESASWITSSTRAGAPFDSSAWSANSTAVVSRSASRGNSSSTAEATASRSTGAVAGPGQVPRLAQGEQDPAGEQADAGPHRQAEVGVGEDGDQGGDRQQERGPAGGPQQAELADAGGQEVEPGVQFLGQLGGGHGEASRRE